MADPELRRMLNLSRALMIASFALSIPLFALLIKTVDEGRAFLDNSNRTLDLLRKYQEQRRTQPESTDMALRAAIKTGPALR